MVSTAQDVQDEYPEHRPQEPGDRRRGDQVLGRILFQSITPEMLPSVTLPLVDQLPKAEEVVASAYDFAEKLLAGQRKFAEDMVKALEFRSATRPRPPSKALSQTRDVKATRQPRTPGLPRTIVCENQEAARESAWQAQREALGAFIRTQRRMANLSCVSSRS